MIEFDALLGSVSTLVAVPVGWWLADKSHARSEARAERVALDTQFDELYNAVTKLRAGMVAKHYLWGHLIELTFGIVHACFIAGAGYAGAQIVGGSKRQCEAVAGGTFVHVVWSEMRGARTAAREQNESLDRVVRAAGPFLRHSSPEISAAVGRLLVVASSFHNLDRLDAPLNDLRSAVQAAITPAPTWGKRLRGRTDAMSAVIQRRLLGGRSWTLLSHDPERPVHEGREPRAERAANLSS
ncbi:hypothetical protein ACWEJ6_52240 [Nonomuraea sp. NPDC004702]